LRRGEIGGPGKDVEVFVSVRLPRLLRRVPFAVVLAIQFVMALVLAEGLLLAMYHYPKAWYPAGLRNFLTTEYFQRRQMVQLDDTHARYDPALVYTLQPGAFMFSNVEFSTQYVVNSLGLRDNQRSLTQPEIVVAGDSYAMGLGVQQEESFPELLERRTGRVVLNSGIASYGTVRERRLLDRVDLTRATTLIVQYDANDFAENDEFAKQGNQYTASSRELWLDAIAQQRRGRKYWPFRMVYDAAVWIKRGITGWPRGGFEPSSYPADAAAARFINAMIHASPRDLGALQIIVFDVDRDPAFIRALDAARRNQTYPAYIRNLRVVDLSQKLTPEMRYVLDDHLNAKGHAAIAETLLAEIEAATSR
jgi:lysophospholipase L1-like esterase